MAALGVDMRRRKQVRNARLRARAESVRRVKFLSRAQARGYGLLPVAVGIQSFLSLDIDS